MVRIVRGAGFRLGYLPSVPTIEVTATPVLSDAERAAVQADGGELAALLGEGPEVTEPTHRLTDLPPGVIGAVLGDGLSFRDAMAAAADGGEDPAATLEAFGRYVEGGNVPGYDESQVAADYNESGIGEGQQ
ncbi:MAG TPA: hypothetical protein VLH86_06300 [Patescibacteria group bacterium]|nr:hypothetical protein [Patescibacteria group bacterium]